MSQGQPQRGGLKIPRQLQQELGLDLKSSNRNKVRYGTEGNDGRRGRHKAEREEKKVARVTGHGKRRTRPQRALSSDHGGQITVVQNSTREHDSLAGPPRSHDQERKPRSILKNTLKIQESEYSTQPSNQERSRSPGLVLDKSSKSFQDRAAHDEAEIRALEKKLGLRTKKLPNAFEQDGLADLLESIDNEKGNRKRKKEGQDWLESKRRKAGSEDYSEEETEGLEGELDPETQPESDEEDSEFLDSEEEDFQGLVLEDGMAAEKPNSRKRENPYVAPPSDSANSATKYVPPSRRKHTDSGDESIQRLRRQIQGQLNKLSESNLISILAEVEKVYQHNARQEVTSTLVDLLISLFCDPSVLQNTFVILHASFVSALYKTIGTDFGADFVSQLVDHLAKFHGANQAVSGKQTVNLISLLSHLFTFRVIGSNLVFDYIRIFLETLNETNAELLLRIVRDAGPQLRQDDPSSLKDIVLIMQKAAARAQAEGVAISVRTTFMMETITDLKNNKLKTEIASAGVASEHIIRMRKVLGSLSSRSLRASEPLRIGLADLQNVDKHGKWWLIGATWKDQEKKNEADLIGCDDNLDAKADVFDSDGAGLLVLARQHRMNTAVRRAIFIATMSATDYQDAHLRLLKLRLKRSQEQEIPRVLLHCAGAEEKYNPYYALIAKTLCADKRLKMAFQFSLWDFFKRMGENGKDMDSDDEEDGEEVGLKEIANTARMFGGLVADGTLSLGILKTLNLALLKDQARMFVEVLLIVVISQSQEGVKEAREDARLVHVFARCRDTPQMIGGLRHFLKRVVRNTDLANSKAEAEQVRWGCGIAMDTLKAVSAVSDRGL